MSDMADDELIQEFLVESYENLDELDERFVELESDPGNVETLSAIFRTIHTIKGTSGFLGLGKLERVTHVGESLLSRLRDGALVLSEDTITALLSLVDEVRRILGQVETDGREGDEDHAELIAQLEALLSGEAPAAAEPMPRQNVGDILVQTTGATPEDVAQAAAEQSEGDPRHLGEILVAKGKIEPDQVRDALEAQQVQARTTSGHSSATEKSIRIDVGLLDQLMNLVGELVLARNQILEYSESKLDGAFLNTSQRLNLVTTELQEAAMKTRMQPIGNVWSKFPRVVRDLSKGCGKAVGLEMSGKETELDRTILEAIKDPLTHLIRNAVDHGIESAEERAARGKPEEGQIVLRAYHEGGQVNIDIEDDGGGIDPDVMREKGVRKGVVPADHAAAMSEREAVNLLFLPGFSTAEKVTNVSGRGVGMDVVKSNIERIGGVVDVVSRVGAGTTFKLKIPLTLAIIPALVVTSLGQRFCIPQVSLVELVRLEGREAELGVEMVHGAPVHRLRGDLLPLVYLNDVLGLPSSREGSDEEHQGKLNIAVLQAEGGRFGLVLDAVNDTQEIVVKPIGSQLKEVREFAGATIMGDGRVALILDVVGLAERAQMASTAQGAQASDAAGSDHAEEGGGRSRSLLLFKAGDDTRMAIPLSTVARLESFPLQRVEALGGQAVIQYREQILPLVRVEDLVAGRVFSGDLGHAEPGEGATISAVVYSAEGGSLGVVVEDILDIVEEQPPAGGSDTEGAEGLVIHGRVTELIDLADSIGRVLPQLSAAIEA